jgi:RNA polymerase sigma factor (TIGR02999 family)
MAGPPDHFRFRVILPPTAAKLGRMSDVTRLLEAAQAGDRKAASDLLPLVYDELRKLAAARMAAESPGHTLDATALVHEAFVRLGGDQSFGSRSAFLRAASEAMRRILIDHARAKRADKRGGGRTRIPAELDALPCAPPNSDLVALDEALTRFATVDPQAAQLVTLRYFGGLTLPDAAAALDISPRTAGRLWAFARAWLYRELSGTFLA